MSDHTPEAAGLRDRIAKAIEHKVKQHPVPDAKPWDPPGMTAFYGCSFADLADALLPLIEVEASAVALRLTEGYETLHRYDQAEIDRADLRADRRAADLRAQNRRVRELEARLAAVRSVLATWEHRTHHGDSAPMDFLRDLQAALRDRPDAQGTDPAATWPTRAADRLGDDARPGPSHCGAPAYGPDGEAAAHCDRPAGHDGWHSTEASIVEWADDARPTAGGGR